MEFAIRNLTLALVLCSSVALCAQAPATPRPGPNVATHPEWPKANPADVTTIESTVHAFYSAISVPAGGRIDQIRLRSLFVPEGRIAIGLPPRGLRAADIVFMTPEQYAASSDAETAKQGFYDRNPANRIERFGVMAHVYSTYESRSKLDDSKPMARGIKSIELLNSDNRWYIVQVYWDSERPDNPLPERYLNDQH
jgi:hypothetical protein